MPTGGYWTIDEDGTPVYVGADGSVQAGGPTDTATVPDQTPAPVDPGEGVSSGQTVSRRGYSEAKAKQVSGRTDSRLGSAYRSIDAQAEADTARDVATLDQGYQAEADRTMSPEQYANAPRTVDVQTGAAEHNAKLLAAQTELEKNLIQRELDAQKVTDAVVQRAQAQYEASVQAYSSMNVDPGKLFKNLSPGWKAGALAAVFVSDFLGARGIKSSGADALNRAIDQSIDAQIQNIQHAGQVTEHFRDLWNMAVQTSATQAEAREKMRGYHLAAFQSYVASEMARYDAPLAQARAADAIMSIEKERAANVVRVRQYHQERAQVAKESALRYEGMILQNSQAMASIGETRRHNKAMERLAEAPAPVQYPVEDAFINPETGRVEAKFIPGMEKGAKDEARTSYAGYIAFQNLVQKFREAQQQYGASYQGLGKNFLKSKEGKRLDSIYTAMVNAYVYATTGKQINENEFKRATDAFRRDTTLDSLMGGASDKILADRMLEANQKYDLLYTTKTLELTPDEKAWFDQNVRGHKIEGGAGASTLAGLAFEDTTPEVSQYGEGFKQAEAPSHQGAIGGVSGSDDSLTDQTRGLWRDSGANTVTDKPEENPRRWALDMTATVDDALREIQAGKSDSAGREAIRREVRGTLERYLDPKSDFYTTDAGKRYLQPEESREYKQKSAFARALIDYFDSEAGEEGASAGGYYTDHTED